MFTEECIKMINSLLVDTSISKLNAIETAYFIYDDKEVENVEGGITRASERNFYLKHPNSNTFLEKMGINNTYYLHKLFLSYYDAFNKLEFFWERYACPSKLNLKADIPAHKIDHIAETHKIEVFDSYTLNHANYLINGDLKTFVNANPFQEYLWAINMNEFLASYRIPPFPVILIENKSIFHSSYLFQTALSKKEVSIALYEWANINNFNQPDFIKRISNVLELIDKDLRRNKDIYDQITKGTDVRDNVYLLNNRIQSNKKWRPFFFGVFNASDLLGAYSRHAQLEIKSIVGFNYHNNLSAEQIVKIWRDHSLLPNDLQFNHLFRFWYITTSILLLNWLRLNHN